MYTLKWRGISELGYVPSLVDNAYFISSSLTVIVVLFESHGKYSCIKVVQSTNPLKKDMPLVVPYDFIRLAKQHK